MTITLGDLRRKAQRNMEFGVGTLRSGPSVLPNGEANDAMVLCFGERALTPRPTEYFVGRRLVVRKGPGARGYAKLSSYEDRFFAGTSSFAISWKRSPRPWYWAFQSPVKTVKP